MMNTDNGTTCEHQPIRFTLRTGIALVYMWLSFAVLAAVLDAVFH